MRLRAALVALIVTLPAVGAVGCAHRNAVDRRVPAPPATIADQDEFWDTLNLFAQLPDDHKLRASYRTVLQGFLGRHLRHALTEGREAEALSALEYAAGLFRPAELRQAAPNPALVTAADQLYRLTARRGAEEPSFLALAIKQHLGTGTQRDAAVLSWELLEAWIVRNSAFSTEPVLRHEELEGALEEVAAIFPSPFVVRRLADLYLARHEAARRAITRGDGGSAGRRRAEFTGYLLIRLHLRADDLDGAMRAVKPLELDLPTRKLLEVVERATQNTKSARPLLVLAEQFVPEEGSEGVVPGVYLTQGWEIVGNLARRAVAAHPADAYAHLLLAQSLTRDGLVDAAIVELERAIDAKEDIFDAWLELASLQQESLARMSARDPAAAKARLPELERFHHRAVELWRDRPIRPGLPEAYFSVADGLYHAGDPDAAEGLLGRSLAIEPVPASLDLLATIDLKQSRFKRARRRYEALASLPFPDELARLRWESRALVQLGEIARLEGHGGLAVRHQREALRELNTLLGSPHLDQEARAQHYATRGKLLFSLGEHELGMRDFEEGIRLSPDDPAMYAEGLTFLVSRGHHEQARQIYHRAVRRTELAEALKVYFSLWLHEVAKRDDAPPDPAVAQFLESFKGETWPRKLAAHALGDLTYAQLLAAATDRGERTEARFYEALRRWHAGDGAAAQALMREVVDSGMMSFFEYEMAQAYLRWGKLPHGGIRIAESK